MKLKDVIEICKTCQHRNKNDNMYFMAWWSYCQRHCDLLMFSEDTLKGQKNAKKDCVV